uniref:(northern house mosquito) hypothetical protein n=1 Tax=Culex pipiens TaxID=7175 RepID=A0A8D8P0U9_CULPI
MWPSVGIRIRRRNTSPPPSSWTSAPAIPSCRTKSSDRSCRSSTWKTRTTLSASSTQDHPLLSCISSRKTKNCKICSFTAHDRAVCASMIRSCSTPLNPYLLEVLALVEWELTMESTPSTRSPTVNPAWRKTST